MVLVIDDFSDTCTIVQKLLEREGYCAMSASSAAEATFLLQSATPDLILMDYMMPDCSGLDLLAHLKKDARFANIPVLMFSASVNEPAIERAKRLGAADWLVKGTVDWSTIVHRIQELHPA